MKEAGFMDTNVGREVRIVVSFESFYVLNN